MVKLKCGDRYIEVDPNFSEDEIEIFVKEDDNKVDNTLELGDVKDGVNGEIK